MDQVTQSNTRKPAVFLDDDLDQISFKPLSSGLGFHSRQNDDVVISKKSPKLPLGTKPLSKNLSISQENSVNHSVAVSSLEQFYSKTSLSSTENNYKDKLVQSKFHTTKMTEKVKQSKASTKNVVLDERLWAEQFLAWAIDMIAVVLLLSLVFYTAPKMAGIDSHILLNLLKQEDLLFFLLAFVSVFYFLYFSILDLYQTPGKLICSIKIVTLGNERASFFSIFFRNVLNVLSVLLLGIPLLLGVVDKISKTKVVRDVAKF